MISRVLLNDQDFKDLVAGKIVKKNNVEIALSDIGFMRMIDHIETTIFNFTNGKENQ